MPIFTTRRLIQTIVAVLLLLGAIYFLFPKIIGLGNALDKLDEADPVWIAIAIGFNVVAYATYIALFKAVVGGDALRLTWKETYEINMAGVAGFLLILGVLVTLIPPDAEHRLARFAHSERSRNWLQAAGKVPATLGEGFRFALGLFAHPRRGGLAVIGAAGFWAASIGVLWASFHAFGVHVPLAVVVQGFFLGMVANLFPLAPAGVGAVDAGMIGAFVLFGIPEETVFPAGLI